MGKMKEAIMEVTEYVIENIEDYYEPKQIPSEDDLYGVVQDMVMKMDEETFFVTLMLTTPTKKA